MSTVVTSDPDVAPAVTAVLVHLCDHSDIPTWLLLRRRDDNQVVIAAADGLFRVAPQEVLPLDLRVDERFTGASIIVAEVRLSDGETIGTLVGLGHQPIRRPHPIEATLEVLADTVGALLGAHLALAHELRLSERASAQADPLTNLASRQAWDARLRAEELRCGRLAEEAAVVLIELDDLRPSSELRGCGARDQQIGSAAAMVRELLTDRHFAARTADGELGIITVGARAGDVATLEHDLRRGLSATGISGTIGVGVRSPDGGLVRAHAEAAAATRAPLAVAGAVRSSVTGSAVTEPGSHLVDALERGAIRAYYQPIVDLGTGEVVAVEALARWQSQDGVREPGSFLHLLDDAGLLGALFERILDDGLEHLAEFRHVAPGLQVAVNIEFPDSPAGGLLACIRERLDRHGLPADALSLDLGQRHASDLSPEVRAEMTAVADAGVALVLDDVGPGVDALDTIAALPIAGIKLARGLTSQVAGGEREAAAVKAVISMAAQAGLVVVAKGIETQEQCNRLIQLGCRFGQGYLFAVPQPADSLWAVLSEPLVTTF